MRIPTQKCKVKLTHNTRLIFMHFLESASKKDTLIHMWHLGKILKTDTYSTFLIIDQKMLPRVNRCKCRFTS